MAHYVITGGAGFIGSHLATALVARGDQVRIVDDFSTGDRGNLAHLATGLPGSGAPVEIFEGDVADGELLARACAQVRGIFHEAAQVSVPLSFEQPVRSAEVNVMGTLRVLEAARHGGARGVVLAASSAAYGNSESLPKVESMTPAPLSPYAVGKLAGEHLLGVWGREFGLHTVALRYFNIFGPRQLDSSPYTGVIAIFARALFEQRAPRIYGDGEQSRDFTYIDNVVNANLLAMDADVAPGTVVNVGSGERVSVNELWTRMAELWGSDLVPEHVPDRAGDVKHSLASLERAKALLGYEPSVSWREGLEQTVAWYRERFAAQAGR